MVDRDIDLEELEKYFMDPDETANWLKYFDDPIEAAHWNQSFVDPKEALKWHKYFDDPELAGRIYNLFNNPRTALKWITEWRKYYPDDEPEVPGEWYDGGFSLRDALKWRKYFEIVDDAVSWYEFTKDPKRAYELSIIYPGVDPLALYNEHPELFE